MSLWQKSKPAAVPDSLLNGPQEPSAGSKFISIGMMGIGSTAVSKNNLSLMLKKTDM